MPLQSSGQISLSDCVTYLYEFGDTSHIHSVYWVWWHTYNWGVSPSPAQKSLSDFYGFEYTVTTDPDPIHKASALGGSVSVQVYTQNGNYMWSPDVAEPDSPFTCDALGDPLSYSWLSVTNISNYDATFDATYTTNTSSSQRTGYIGINIYHEDTEVITVTQAGSTPS